MFQVLYFLFHYLVKPFQHSLPVSVLWCNHFLIILFPFSCYGATMLGIYTIYFPNSVSLYPQEADFSFTFSPNTFTSGIFFSLFSNFAHSFSSDLSVHPWDRYSPRTWIIHKTFWMYSDWRCYKMLLFCFLTYFCHRTAFSYNNFIFIGKFLLCQIKILTRLSWNTVV